MSSRRVARGEQVLEKLGNRLGMTEKGRQWLIGALDPYHDTPLDVCGYPDGNKNPVCVQIVRQSYNVQCPAAITTGTWDAQIMLLPFTKSTKFGTLSFLGGTNTNPTNEAYRQSTGVNVNYGGLTIQTAATGTSFNPSVAAPSSTNVINPNGIPDQYMHGNARVIGKAFEVHNTTSELNKQGMCTTWTIPVGDYNAAGTFYTALDTVGTLSQQGYASIFKIPMWPDSQANAVLIPGSRQWTADQGAYIVPRLEITNIPVSEDGFPIQPYIDSGDDTTTHDLMPVPAQSGIDTTHYAFTNCFWDSFDMRGSLFSGLSLQSTLTVNVTWIIERQPDTTISDLVVLAVQPPERDNVAIDLYTHITDHIPAGVPVGENGLGDWFMDALSTAADFIAPVASAIPGVGGAISAGIGGLNNLYKQHKKDYETNPYAAVTTNEVRGVYNAASSVIGQLKGNREKRAVKQEVKAEVRKELGGGRMIGPQTLAQATKSEKRAIKREKRKLNRARVGPRRQNGQF